MVTSCNANMPKGADSAYSETSWPSHLIVAGRSSYIIVLKDHYRDEVKAKNDLIE